MNSQKQEELEISKVRKQVEENTKLEKILNLAKIKRNKGAIEIIKDQIVQREAKNLPNDWKPDFYRSKLSYKKSLISTLSKLIK